MLGPGVLTDAALPAPIVRLRRLIGRHRRLVAAVSAFGAVLLALTAVQPRPPSVTVLVAARDLPPGTELSASALTRLRLPPSAVPSGALAESADLHKRVLATGLRRGEVVTDLRLVGRPLLTLLPPDTAAVAVSAADAGLAALLQPGDRVEVLSPDGQGDSGSGSRSETASSGSDGPGTDSPDTDSPDTDSRAGPQVLTSNALVLSTRTTGGSNGGGGLLSSSTLDTSTPGASGSETSGPGLVLAVPRSEARAVVAAGAAAPLPLLLLAAPSLETGPSPATAPPDAAPSLGAVPP